MNLEGAIVVFAVDSRLRKIIQSAYLGSLSERESSLYQFPLPDSISIGSSLKETGQYKAICLDR